MAIPPNGEVCLGTPVYLPQREHLDAHRLAVDKEYEYPTRGINKYVAAYIESLPDLTGKVVVDIPCGDGRSSYSFSRKGATVKAFDLYPEFMKAEGIDAQYADLTERIPVEDSTADYLICQEGIEHIPDKVKLFREFNRSLKKGGTLIITAPNISHARARVCMFLLESEFWRRMPPTEIDSVWFTEDKSDRLYFGHLFLVGVQHLQTLCSLSGFDVVDRRRSDPGNTSIILGILLYPLIAVASFVAYRLYGQKNDHVTKKTRLSILWDRVKLNLAPTTLFYKHVFWVMRKEKEYSEVIEDLKTLTRYS